MAKDPIPHKRKKTLHSHMHSITVLQNMKQEVKENHIHLLYSKTTSIKMAGCMLEVLKNTSNLT